MNVIPSRCDAARGASAALATFVAVLAVAGLAARLGGRAIGQGNPPEGTESARVGRVVDGDTLTLVDGRTVRLLGLDAPETVNPQLTAAQPFGPEAGRRLTELVQGRIVHLERDSTESDHYGRALRHVWLGGTLVAEVLVGEGLAWANPVPPDVRHRDTLRDAETAARNGRIGLWSLPRPTPLPVFAVPER